VVPGQVIVKDKNIPEDPEGTKRAVVTAEDKY
jgi:hypothetical protein